MILTNNSVYLANLENGISMQSVQIANALSLELFNYGVVIKRDLFANMIRTPSENLWPLAQNLLARHTVGNLTPALFKNWESRTFFSIPEMVVQIFGYMIQLSGNDLRDIDYMPNLLSEMGIRSTEFEVIELASSNEVSDAVKRTSNVTQNRSQKSVAKAVVDKGEWIPNPEARTEAMLNEGVSSLETMKLASNDVMRFFAARRDDTQWILPSEVLFDSMTWQERKASMKFLNSFKQEKLLEAMGHNRQAWFRFVRHAKLMRQKQFVNSYPDLVGSLFVSMGSDLNHIPIVVKPLVKRMIADGMVELTESNNLVYRTFASRVQMAIRDKNYRWLHSLMETNHNYLLKNIATVSNGVAKSNKSEFMTLVRQALKGANQQTLFSILQIDTKAEYRIIDIKGMTTVQDAKYSDILTAIQLDIENELRDRYGVANTFIVDAELKNRVVPFLAKNQNIDRGTAVDFRDEKYLYFFMKWTQADRKRTDLDHSWLIVKDNGSIDTIAFYNSANDFISQSGDITNAPAPNGATEYSKITLAGIPKDVKYIIPVINVYSGDNFKDLPEAYAGFFFSDSNRFSINNEHTRYALDQPARVNMPFAINAKTGEIVITDFNVKKEGYGNVARDYAKDVVKVADAAQTLNKMTIQMFADLLGGDDKEMPIRISEKMNPDDTWMRVVHPQNLSDFLV